MNLFRRIATNTVWLFAAQAASKGSGFLVAILLSRYLGATGFGEYSFVCAYVGFFILITEMGIDMFVTREASRDLRHSEALVGNAVILKAFFSILAFILSVGAAAVLGIPHNKLALIAIASLGLLLAPLTLYGAAFSATLRLYYPAMFEILGRVLLVALVITAVIKGGSLVVVFTFLVLPGGLVAMLNVVYARRLFRPRFEFQWPISASILRKALPIAISLLMTQIVFRIDQVMLEWMRGDHELGLYSAGVKCCEALNVIPGIFLASVFPLLSRAARTSEESFSRIYHLSFKYLSLAIFPLVVLLYLYPGEILTILFGEAFLPGATSLRILCWSAIFVAMGYVIGTAAVSLDYQRLFLGVSVFLAGLNVVLNLLLIPRTDVLGGANGAAIATLISYSASLFVLLLIPTLRPIALSFIQNSVKPLVALIPIIVIVFVTSLTAVHGIVASVVIYLVTIIMIKGLDRSDREYVRSIFR